MQVKTEGGTGHPGFICHKQPAIEKHLRNQINTSGKSDLRLGVTLTSIHEDEDWVYATYMGSNGDEKSIQSKFLVGADGKTGFTRKKYLEPRGVSMERVSQTSYEEVWVALNWRMTLPTPETHPEFPLWAKGYTPQQVYNIFFPEEFRFLCNPERAAVCGRFGLNEDRLWRFEFVVLPGEDGDTMASPEMIHRIVFPYITQPGSRFGLIMEKVQNPEDCIEIIRSRPFNFSARSCNRWAQDRVMLCGDAAHVFPPFGGQGIASGFRDAISLAWRLAMAARTASSKTDQLDHRSFLETWYTERKQQLDRSLAFTIENGSYVTESDPVKIYLRELYLWAVQLVPSWKHNLELGGRREGMVRYRAEPGKSMHFLPDMGGGGNFPQVYCVDLRDASEKVRFTDDVIFAPHKTAAFQIVAFLNSEENLAKSREILDDLSRESKGILNPRETTFIVRKSTYSLSPKVEEKEAVYRLATGAEFAADDFLCRGRPEPQFYDPLRISKDVNNKMFVILRPDRFIYAACDTQSELSQAARSISDLFHATKKTISSL